MWKYVTTDELYHHGVKGMRWGVRRYQNADGTLTDAGKKRYNKMSNDQLQKALYKQVKKARSAQSDWSNQWNVSNTIGKHSKAAADRYRKDYDEYTSSKTYSEAVKRAKALDNRFNRGEIDPDKYNREYEKIMTSVYRPEFDSSVTYGHSGRKYAQAYLDKYGKDLNVGYLRDLGYDESTAKAFAERVLKADRKMLNGM